MHEFFVIMQKYPGEKVYADLHKAHDTFFLVEEEASAYMNQMAQPGNWHVVRLVASMPETSEH